MTHPAGTAPLRVGSGERPHGVPQILEHRAKNALAISSRNKLMGTEG